MQSVSRPERFTASGITRPVAFEGSTGVLFGHMWLCQDEHWRMVRAFGRGRPLQRVYARLRRIVIMLDLAWTCQDDDAYGTILRDIESLMTWHPTLKKGMRLPIPDEARYQAALRRLGTSNPSQRVQAAVMRLHELPENPIEWRVPGDADESGERVRQVNRNLHDCYIIQCAIFRRVLERISPTQWDWLEIADEGIFKLMSFDHCDISLATPASGVWRRFNLPSLIWNRRLAMVDDPETLIKLEKTCVCPVRLRSPLSRQHDWLPAAELEVGAWICRPVLGQVVSIEPNQGGQFPLGLHLEGATQGLDPGTEKAIGIRQLDGRIMVVLASALPWTTLAESAIAADPRRLARCIGLFIKAHEQARKAGTEVESRLQPGILFRMPANLDRVVALWIALHLDHLVAQSARGKSIQPGGFIVFRQLTSLGVAEMNALRGFLLGQMRAELAARGDTEALRLVAPLLHLARRAIGGPAFWNVPAGQELRDQIILACRGKRQEWVRTSQHVSIPRIEHQWLYRLLAIADGRSLEQLLIAWLFDIGDLRYRWTSGAEHRLKRLAAFWHAYASYRDRPRLSRYRQARGELLNLLDSFAQSDAAFINAARQHVMNRFHELAEATHRSEAEIINEALTGYLAADRRYVEALAARIAAADRGEFASEDEVARSFAE